MKYLAPFFIVILLCGCNNFNGQIVFENTSPRNVVVNRVYGFSHEPPVGYLITNSKAGSSLSSMKFPDEITIEWWYQSKEDKWESDGEVYKTKVDLSDLPKPNGSSELIITFSATEKWMVKVKK